MNETLNTFTHRTKVYYALQTGSIAFFIFLFFAYKYDLQKPKALLITVFLFGIVTVITNMILTFTNAVKMYIVDGEINFSETGIRINSMLFPFENIKTLEISTKDYKGARASDGSGNKIVVIDTSNNRTACRFIISSIDQRDKLKVIIEAWKTRGLSIQQL